MEFISQLFVALFSLFFGDCPFSLDDDFYVQEEEVFPKSPKTPNSLPAQGPILLTPENRKWNPSIPSAPRRPRRLIFEYVVAEKKIVVDPPQQPLRRMGIRV
jgi:hypothetical protein